MEINPDTFEKLGVFYLGKTLDLKNPEAPSDLLLYDSKDLTTHAVVVGMTGSGKTGLCIDILEEAGMDKIPAIVIDPKGDIANILLTFPELTATEFEPWVDPGQATREGIGLPEFAAKEAEKWQKGLAKWGQSGERIRKFRETVEMRVYTPGSTTGRPLTILKSFNAPPQEVLDDSDAIRERISSAASGLLALLGIDADPIRSREHILVSQILNSAWTQGKNLDLGTLISQIQSPPFNRVGVMELDTFFPAKDRTELAMTMNNLLASPSFASWMQGESLNIKELLHNSEGKPCISVLSIAHLNDAERMFFVTILLNEVLAWMRTQAGTSSLRALLYMDEVFGYFPPSKNPPSKQPMLTLLKQARAFGLGVVLATQNPVDLDYKGLSNTGTWFLGRLQTERDKMRVIEGLEGAAAQTGTSFDRGEMEQILAGLGARKFLMNNVHDDRPTVFETRWCMSYLRGPLTRQQLQKLVPKPQAAESNTIVRPSANSSAAAPVAAPAAKAATEPAAAESSVAASYSVSARQLIPHEIEQRHLEPSRRPPVSAQIEYRPALFGRGKLHFTKSTYKVDEWVDRQFLLPIDGGDVPPEAWEGALALTDRPEWSTEDPEEVVYLEPPASLQSAKNFKSYLKDFKDYLYRSQSYDLFYCNEMDCYSQPGETLGDFKVRLESQVSEFRDRETEKLRAKFQDRYQTMRTKIDRAQDTLDREQAQYKSKRMESILDVGTSIMGALLGRKSTRRATSSARSFGQASTQKADVSIAESKLDDLQNQYQDLDREFNLAMEEVAKKASIEKMTFETINIPPKKTDLSVEEFFVAWVPWFAEKGGTAKPGY
jgi:Helicase HerA, central domain